MTEIIFSIMAVFLIGVLSIILALLITNGRRDF